MIQYRAAYDEFPRVLNCLDILSEDKDAATSSTADSLLKNIFSFNFVLGIMTLNSVLSHTSRLRVPQPAQQYLFSIYIYYLPLCPLRPHTSLGLSQRLVLGAAVTSQCGAGTHLVAGSVPNWLPSGCFVRNIGTTCCTWRQFSGRWWFLLTKYYLTISTANVVLLISVDTQSDVIG